MKNLQKAIILAVSSHEGQKRWDGTPYVLHPLRVMNKLLEKHWTEDEILLVCAVLHDVIEDTSITIDYIKQEFWKETARTLALLTHEKDESYETYIATLLKDRRACLIKLADIEDNSAIENSLFSTASEEKQAKRASKYLAAYKLIKESLWKAS